jgi:transposase-like protein
MAALAAWGASNGFRRSEPGDRFNCTSCGRVFALIEKTPGAGFKWTLVEYGRQ